MEATALAQLVIKTVVLVVSLVVVPGLVLVVVVNASFNVFVVVIVAVFENVITQGFDAFCGVVALKIDAGWS